MFGTQTRTLRASMAGPTAVVSPRRRSSECAASAAATCKSHSILAAPSLFALAERIWRLDDGSIVVEQ